jgi:hypothetical protein
VVELVVDLSRERRAEHRDRRGEHELRMIAAAGGADRFEQAVKADQVDAVAFLEIGLGLARDDRREMERSHRGVRLTSLRPAFSRETSSA